MTRHDTPLFCPQSGRAHRRMLGFVLPVIGVFALASPAVSQSHGDGSGTSNPALGGHAGAAQCAYWWQCDTSGQTKTKTAPPQKVYKSPEPQAVHPVFRESDCDALVPGAVTPEHCAVELGSAQSPPHIQSTVPQIEPAPINYARNAPQETQMPLAFEPDWNVGLRSGFENSASGSQFVVSVLPSFSLRHGFARGDVTIAGNSEIVLEQNNGVRIANGNVSVDANYGLGRNTSVTGGAALTASQDSAFSSGITSGVSAEPIILAGRGNATITHQMGRVGLAARGAVARQVYGTTQMQSGTEVDNSDLSNFNFGGGLRASFDISRTTQMFVDGSIERNFYDAVSTSAGVKLDNWTYGLRGGLTMNIGRTIQAELAGGYGLRQFDSAGLAATPAWLASAQISVRPEERLSFIGTVSTEFAIPDSGTSTSEIDYIASLTAQYQVSSQLGLRANLGGEWREVIDGANGWEITAGAGADFAINTQTALTADYTFTNGQTDGSAAEQSHQISLGVRYGRNSLTVSNP